MLRGDTGGMLLRCVAGRPVSQVAEDFLGWACDRLAAEGKRALLLVWDNASWHVNCRMRARIKAHNRPSHPRASRSTSPVGGVRKPRIESLEARCLMTLSGSDGRLHPDFGQVSGGTNPLYGIPYNIVHGNTARKVHVVIDAYAGESDAQDAPVPANAALEGDVQTGQTVGITNRGDSHRTVYDVATNIA